MANLDDLGFKSVTEMSNDEALELLRQIRLSRRTPVKRTKVTTRSTKKTAPKIDANMAAKLLDILGGK